MKLIYIFILSIMSFSCGEKEQKVYKAEIQKASSEEPLKFTSGICSIFQDRKGNYWFGSLNEGVAMFNGISFTYFNVYDGLTDNQIHNIQEDNEGIIWFTTQHGVCSYDGKKIVKRTKTDSDNSQFNLSIQPHRTNLNEWKKFNNDLWFKAGKKEGVFRYDGHTLNYLAFPPHKILNIYDNLFATTAISKGKKNKIWFATYAGIFGFNGINFEIINDETLGFDSTIATLHIRSILEDSKGRLWIGNNGIGVLLKEGDSIINFSEKNNLIHLSSGKNGDKSMPGTLEHVFTIEEDSDGNIWFGDRDAGIWKYNGETMTNFSKQDGLTNDFALSIFDDKNGNLLFGMADGKILKFNGKTFEKRF